jgi:hypothetical protein
MKDAAVAAARAKAAGSHAKKKKHLPADLEDDGANELQNPIKIICSLQLPQKLVEKETLLPVTN